MGIMHGLNDCAAGFVLGNLAFLHTDATDIGLWILIYNILAFAAQAPLAIAVDAYTGRLKEIFSIGVVSNAIGFLLVPIQPLLAVVALGIGSAIVHVVGGSVSLQSQPEKAGVVGLFAAPGVMGLALGGFAAYVGLSLIWPLVFAMALIFGLTLMLRWPLFTNNAVSQQSTPGLDRHDWVMMGLLLVIAMRSAIWNTFQLINQGDYHLLLLLAAAAMGGKLLGGFVADRVGWKGYAMGALLLAAPLLSFGARKPWILAIGVGLLQSATPLALAAMHRSLSGRPALASGLTFGLAIALGGIPMLMGWQWLSEPWSIFVGTVLLAGAYFGVLRLQQSPSKEIVYPNKV